MTLLYLCDMGRNVRFFWPRNFIDFLYWHEISWGPGIGGHLPKNLTNFCNENSFSYVLNFSFLTFPDLWFSFITFPTKNGSKKREEQRKNAIPISISAKNKIKSISNSKNVTNGYNLKHSLRSYFKTPIHDNFSL